MIAIRMKNGYVFGIFQKISSHLFQYATAFLFVFYLFIKYNSSVHRKLNVEHPFGTDERCLFIIYLKKKKKRCTLKIKTVKQKKK